MFRICRRLEKDARVMIQAGKGRQAPGPAAWQTPSIIMQNLTMLITGIAA